VANLTPPSETPGGPTATSPHLRKAPRREPLKHWAEIEHDVLRTVLVGLGGEAAEEEAAARQRNSEMIDSLDRIGEMLEDVHRRDHVEGIGWKRRVFQIDELRRQASSLHAPLAESEQSRADVGVGDVEPMPGEEKTAGPDASPEVEIAATAPPLASEIQREHIGEWSMVGHERVPPHQLEEVTLPLIVELFDGPGVSWIDHPPPIVAQRPRGVLAARLKRGQIHTSDIGSQLAQETLP